MDVGKFGQIWAKVGVVFKVKPIRAHTIIPKHKQYTQSIYKDIKVISQHPPLYHCHNSDVNQTVLVINKSDTVQYQYS